jgi:hypothetical protein
MQIKELQKHKLKEARYDTFIKKIVLDAINKKDKTKVYVILSPGL